MMLIAIAVMIIGDEEISSGMRVVGAHIDSPRLELRGKPLFFANEFALGDEFKDRYLYPVSWLKSML